MCHLKVQCCVFRPSSFPFHVPYRSRNNLWESHPSWPWLLWMCTFQLVCLMDTTRTGTTAPTTSCVYEVNVTAVCAPQEPTTTPPRTRVVMTRRPAWTHPPAEPPPSGARTLQCLMCTQLDRDHLWSRHNHGPDYPPWCRPGVTRLSETSPAFGIHDVGGSVMCVCQSQLNVLKVAHSYILQLWESNF